MGSTTTGASASPSLKLALWVYLSSAILALYLCGTLVFWVWTLGDGAAGSFRLLTLLHVPIPKDADAINLVKLAYFTAVGGGVGGVTFGMVNLHKHVTAGTFRIEFSGDYLFRHLGSAALSLVVFSLARGGILTVLGADPTTSGSATLASKLSALGVGFLVGFASLEVSTYLNGLARRLFKKH